MTVFEELFAKLDEARIAGDAKVAAFEDAQDATETAQDAQAAAISATELATTKLQIFHQADEVFDDLWDEVIEIAGRAKVG